MPQDITAARERFKNYLRSRNLRKTPERFALLDKAVTIPGHFDVDTLYESMEKTGYHVSRATVYSTLELLVDCALLNRHQFGTRKTSYEVAISSHFHLICTICGKIKEIEEEEITERLNHINIDGFKPSYFSTTVYGICKDCIHKQL